MAWTDQQQTAIETQGCGLLVSAAAGSGKTSVLVERLLKILSEDHPDERVPADRMIVVTFTNDAASNMKTRLTNKLSEQLEKQPQNTWLHRQQILLQSAHICTISSFCFDLIRDNLTESGVSTGFRILNETENRMICEKQVDLLLNRWHTERPEEMHILWDAFCEKSDKPIERILLDLYDFLGSIPFRDIWETNVISQLNQDAFNTLCHQFLEMERSRAQSALNIAQQAEEIAQGLYDSLEDNTVYFWIEEDCTYLTKLVQMLQKGTNDIDILLDAYNKITENRTGHTFPRKKKSITNSDNYDEVKRLREQYKKILDSIIIDISSILPFEQQDLDSHRTIVPILLEMEDELFSQIIAAKSEKNALSFEDGERIALELLSDRNEEGQAIPSPLARDLSAYYQLIMIDEYQDSNNKQDQIFKLLSHQCLDPQTGQLRYGNNMFLVGDIKQSIYGFRLANPQNFTHAIAASTTPNSVSRHITLNYNFRSTPSILSFVNFLCGNLMTENCGGILYDKNEALEAGLHLDKLLPKEDQGVEIAVLSESNEEDEDNDVEQSIRYIIATIQDMIARGALVLEKDGTTRPCEYGDFCILLRDNPNCRKYAHALQDANIPVEIPDETGYLKAREIRVLLDMLRIIDNPLLDTSMATVMLSPMFWFTPDNLLEIRDLLPNGNLYPAIRLMAERKSDNGTKSVLSEKCEQLLTLITDLRERMGMMSLEALIRYIFDSTDYLSIIRLTENGSKKYANSQLLLQYVRQYEENASIAESGIAGFLSYIDWLVESGHDFTQTPLSIGSDNVVKVRTMHRSKGLEFPFVFLAELEHRFSTADKKMTAVFSDNGQIGLCLKDPLTHTRAKTIFHMMLSEEKEHQLKSEEMRLLYVAMTRAQQKLFLTLNKSKITTKSRNYIKEYASAIAPDGTLPISLVQSATSMAQWIWMSLTLLHDTELNSIIPLPKATWQAPNWTENVSIQYTSTIPAKRESPIIESTPLSNEDIVNQSRTMQNLIDFSCYTENSTRRSSLSASALQALHHNQTPAWKRPNFCQTSTHMTGAERGTAIHAFFQFANFSVAAQNLDKEKERLVTMGFLTRNQVEQVTKEIIDAFFADPVYARCQKSHQILREHKFLINCKDLAIDDSLNSILAEYRNADSMMKGIIDLAFLEDDGYVLVDYKTDFVTHPQQLIEKYREQVLIYRAALFAITNRPVTACYLYSTHLKRSIYIDTKETISP